jgi:hypothetical protein
MRHLSYLLAALAPLIASTGAQAQAFGPYSWQTQPYCNVITVRVIEQGGGLYQLVGSDDLCGAGVGPVSGTAVLSAGGAVLGLTVALPAGRPAQLSATIDLASVSGTWTDGDGRMGAFAFGVVAPGGAPRPSPGPRVQRLTYTGTVTSPVGGVSPAAKLRDLVSFTSTGPGVRLTWTSHAAMNPGGFSCSFQLRIDGQPSVPVSANIGLVGDEAVINTGTSGAVPVTLVTWFPTLAAGTHTVELWIRAQSGTCTENEGNYIRTVLVEEFGATP